ncbi:MAG: hypothetical protein MJZ69_07650 [Bacteroidaceae bacterium]|nr:hypothetical protein [Bacteroidaceae bacterium]
MRCPICGSTDTRKGGRSGEYFCNRCVSYFDVVDSAWHKEPQKSKRSFPSSGAGNAEYSKSARKTVSSATKNTSSAEEQKEDMISALKLLGIILLCLLMIVTIQYCSDQYGRRKHREKIHHKKEVVNKPKHSETESTSVQQEDKVKSPNSVKTKTYVPSYHENSNYNSREEWYDEQEDEEYDDDYDDEYGW